MASEIENPTPPLLGTFDNEKYPKCLLQSLNDLRASREFCDVVIKIEETEFYCHKCVLVASIPFFSTMFRGDFKESKQEYVSLDSFINCVIMNLLLNYVYSGSIRIDSENAKGLLLASDYLNIMDIRTAAAEFIIKNINPSNWLEFYTLPELKGLNLQQKAFQLALKNFEVISNQEEFLKIDKTLMLSLVSDDELVVSDERAVFSAVMKWFIGQPDKTEICIHQILDKVRLCLIDLSFLHGCFELFPYLKELPEIVKLIDEAKLYHMFPDRNLKKFALQSRPRVNSSFLEVIMYVCGTDEVGLSASTLHCYNLPEKVSRKITHLRCAKIVNNCNSLLVYGEGTHFKTNFYKVDMDLNMWIELEDMSMFRTQIELVAVDGYFYAVGGFNKADRTVNIERFYDMRWCVEGALQASVSKAAVVSHNGKIYIIGGFTEDDVSCNYLQRFDCLSRSVTILSPMITERARASACVFDDHIYVIGGVYEYCETTGHFQIEYLKSVERYSIDNDSWESVAPMKEPRADAGVAAMNGNIYVAAGMRSEDDYVCSWEYLKSTSNKWKILNKYVAKKTYSCTVAKVPKTNYEKWITKNEYD